MAKGKDEPERPAPKPVEPIPPTKGPTPTVPGVPPAPTLLPPAPSPLPKSGTTTAPVTDPVGAQPTGPLQKFRVALEGTPVLVQDAEGRTHRQAYLDVEAVDEEQAKQAFLTYCGIWKPGGPIQVGPVPEGEETPPEEETPAKSDPTKPKEGEGVKPKEPR